MNKIIFIILMFLSFNSYSLDYVKLEKDSINEYEGQKILSKDRASGIQWNENYIVTAKHVNFVKNSVYECSKDCDLRFIESKNPNGTHIDLWRNNKPHEKLIIIGNSITSEDKIVIGNNLDLKLYVLNGQLKIKSPGSKNTNTLVNVMDNCISPGQSGGPVYGEDGKIVGMAIGHTMIYDQKGNEKLVSVYIPYKIIEKEWKKFELRLDKKIT